MKITFNNITVHFFKPVETADNGRCLHDLFSIEDENGVADAITFGVRSRFINGISNAETDATVKASVAKDVTPKKTPVVDTIVVPTDAEPEAA